MAYLNYKSTGSSYELYKNTVQPGSTGYFAGHGETLYYAVTAPNGVTYRATIYVQHELNVYSYSGGVYYYSIGTVAYRTADTDVTDVYGNSNYVFLGNSSNGTSVELSRIPLSSAASGWVISYTSSTGTITAPAQDYTLTRPARTIYVGASASSPATVSIPAQGFTFKRSKFNINFNTNGGSPSVSSTTAWYGQVVNAPSVSLTKDPTPKNITCTFAGNGLSYTGTDTQSITTSYSFSKWSPQSVTVTGDATFSAEFSSSTPPTKFQLPVALTRTGYTFSNWNTNSNGTGRQEGLPGQTQTSSEFTTDITLYAIWTPDVNIATIKHMYINKNNEVTLLPDKILGSSKPEDATLSIAYGSEKSYTAPDLASFGFINPKFYKTADITQLRESSSTVKIKGDEVYNNKNLVVYCLYSQTIYSYTLNPMEGYLNADLCSGTFRNTDEQIIIGDSKYRPIPKDENSTFIGWEYKGKYWLSFDPSEVYSYSPLVFKAEYQPVDIFVKMADGWHAILNTWVWKNNEWHHEDKPREEGKRYTDTTFFVYKDGTWHQGKTQEI